jgi:hypothetical protein
MRKLILALFLACSSCMASYNYLVAPADGSFQAYSGGYYLWQALVPTPTSDLVLEYLFGANGSESTITLDTSGNNYTGTVSGATWNVATNGLIHNYDFDRASSDYIDATTALNSVKDLQKGFISYWFKTTSTDPMFVISGSDSGDASSQCGFALNVGEVGVYMRDNGTYSLLALSPLTYNDGLWHHYIYSTGTGTNVHYIDGEKITMDYTTGNAGDNVFFADTLNIDWVGVAANNDGTFGIENEFDGLLWNPQIGSTETVITEALAAATNATQKVQLGIASRASSDLNLDATKVFDITSNGDGSAPQDGSTNNATVTATQLADYDLGVTNGASTYNGSTSKGVVADSDKYSFIDKPFSVSAWVRPSSATGIVAIVSKAKWSPTSTEWHAGFTDGAPVFVCYGQSNLNRIKFIGSNALPVNVWSHVYYQTYGGISETNMLVKVNGETVTGDQIMDGTYTGMSNTTNGLNIGHLDGLSLYYGGDIDELKIYGSVFDPSSLYTNESTLFGNFPYYASIPQYDNLVWGASFNAANSGKSQDWSNMGRNGNHGSDTDVVKSVATGDAEFNGSTSEINDSDFSNLGTNSMTFAQWVKIDNLTDDRRNIINFGSGSSAYLSLDHILQDGHRRFRTFISNGGANGFSWTTTNLVLASDVWYHVAVVRDNQAQELKIYVDGEENYIVDTALDPTQTIADSYRIGSSAAGTVHFDGFVDDPLIWNTALSSNEVSSGLFDLTKRQYGYLQGWDDEAWADDTVGLWTFNRNDSTDTGGRANVSTDTSMTYDFGKAVFDGSASYISVADNVDDWRFDNITVFLWFKPDDTLDETLAQNQHLINKGWNTSWGMWYTKFSTGMVARIKVGGSTYDTFDYRTFDAGEWAFQAFTYDGSQLVMYHNGLPVSTNSAMSGNLTMDNVALNMGRYPTSQYYDGIIDNSGVINTALSAADIYSIYTNANYQPGGVIIGQ